MNSEVVITLMVVVGQIIVSLINLWMQRTGHAKLDVVTTQNVIADQKLDHIEVETNSKLTEALNRVATLEAILMKKEGKEDAG